MRSRAIIVVVILVVLGGLFLTGIAESHVRYPETRVGVRSQNFTPDFEKEVPQNPDYTSLEQFLTDSFTSSTLVIQKEFDSTHLAYFGARYYDPTTGRFTNPDPFMGHLGDPRSQFMYGYGFNNPLMFVDPYGEFNIKKFFSEVFDEAKQIYTEIKERNTPFVSGGVYSSKEYVSQAVRSLEEAARVGLTIGVTYYVVLPGIGSVYCVMEGYIEGGEEAAIAAAKNEIAIGMASMVGGYIIIKSGEKLAKLRRVDGEADGLLGKAKRFFRKPKPDISVSTPIEERSLRDLHRDVDDVLLPEAAPETRKRLAALENDLATKSTVIESFPEWRPGGSITQLTREGDYPQWFSLLASEKANTIQGRYWINRASLAEPSEFTTRQLSKMRAGFAPMTKIRVRHLKTGNIEIKNVSKELHHNLGNRGVPGFDEPLHIREVWPWEHSIIDYYRRTGYEFLSFIE